MNAPETFESHILPPDVKKISAKKDGKIQNAATFTIEREDHTVGNILCMELLRDHSNVLYSGYRVPHPLEYKVALKIQTTANTTPAQALSNAISNLKMEISRIREKAEEAMKEFHANQPSSEYP